MDQQAQHTPRKDGTDGKEAEEKDTEKETEGHEVGTEVNHQESRNMLGETTSTFTIYCLTGKQRSARAPPPPSRRAKTKEEHTQDMPAVVIRLFVFRFFLPWSVIRGKG
jgi:hypothetical protein